MKKLLLASTALVMSAGVAAADVALSGDGRMGIVYNNQSTASSKLSFNSRVRVMFTLSGETDGGLAFGGRFRAHTAVDAASSNMGMNGATIFIAGDFGRLTMGDTVGAVQGAVGDLHGVGLTGLGDLNENTFIHRDFNSGLGNTGGTNALYTYSIDGLTLHASLGQLNAGFGASNAFAEFGPQPGVGLGTRIEMYGVGARYEFEGFAVGGGYEHLKAGSFSGGHFAIGGEANFEGVSVIATAGRLTSDLASVAASRNQMGLSVSGSFDAVTVSAFGRRDFARDRHLGIGAAYDLGGGATFAGGVRHTNFNAAGASNQTVADLGVRFSF